MLKPVWAAILAAGAGSRLSSATSGVPKQFFEWRGRPLYWHSALVFSRIPAIEGLVFVFPSHRLDAWIEETRKLAWRDNFGMRWLAVPGGQRRQDSSRNAVAAMPRDAEVALIHDAARCFVNADLVMRVLDSVSRGLPGVVPALPLSDTIKLVESGLVERSLERQKLAAVQTPQGFYLPALRQALACCDDMDVTDDAMLMERAGYRVGIVAGCEENRKMTNPADLALLHERNALPCSGFGYDAHRFGSGRPLRLGGVLIEGEYEVIAHSDGDVLLHSLIDALFGCAGLGDIGRHFPDSDSAYSGISSALLLDLCLEKVRAAGVQICHVDLTVVAQKPRLARHGDEIRRNVARLLSLGPDSVNFKATTEEGMGFTGALEGIKAFALVSAVRTQV